MTARVLFHEMVPSFDAIGDEVEHREQQYILGNSGQIVSVSGIEGCFVVEGHLSGEDPAFLPTDGFADVAARGDESGLSGVCRAGNGASVLDGAQTGDGE